MKVTEWAFDRIKEAFEQMAKDEARMLSIVQEIMIRSTGYLQRIIAPAGRSKEALRCHTCAHIVTVSRWKTSFGGLLRNFWWCAICGEKYDWKRPNWLLVVQTGESVNQAKIFKAHAVPQGLCGNLILALKLLANQQEDGDGLIQSIVTNFGEGSRKGLTKGLRDFIKIENHRALEVRYLNEGMGKFKVRRPKGSDGCPEVTVRESPDEVTLRADEVGTWKSYINVDHTAK